jgi:hypothetical protein
MALLDLADPGLSVAEWTTRSRDTLPQGKGDRRGEVLGLVRTIFLDVEEGRLARSTFTGLFRGGSPRLRRQLFFARWASSNPWAVLAAREVLQPHLALLEKPLSPEGAGEIPFSRLKDFVRYHLPEGIGEASVERTASAITMAFAGLGSLERRGTGGKVLVPRRTVPDALAFGWLVRHQLETEHRTEVMDDWAATESDAALLFATDEPTARRLLDEAVAAGLLVRGYLAGAGRLQLPAPAFAGAGGDS